MTVTAPFAAIQASINADHIRMLADAVATVVLPVAALGRELAVQFDDAYQFIDISSGLSSSAPAASLLESDLPEALRDALDNDAEAALEIRGHTYQIVAAQPDGTGWVVLRLRK